MSDEKRILEVLKVDHDEITKKCAKASRWLMESKLFSRKTNEDLVAFLNETFTEGEIKFMAIGYIAEKTDQIMKTLPGLDEFIDETVSKHGMPQTMAESIKDVLGVNKKPTSEEGH